MAADDSGDDDVVLAAFDQAPTMLVLCKGPDLVVSVLNRSARTILGDGVGLPADEAFEQFAGQQFIERLHEVYATGTPYVGHEWRLEKLGTDDADTEVYVDFTMSPIVSSDGTVRGVVSALIDVTDAIGVSLDLRALSSDDRQQEDELVTTLQDALLPPSLPILPGLEVAARYLLGGAGTSAGGDWFDAIPLPDGRVGLVVGDVAGHGPGAAVAMGQLRTVLEESLSNGADLVTAVEQLDRRARRVPDAHSTSLCAVVLDPATGSMAYCTAGHPPPIVVESSGSATYLPASGSSPLGSARPVTVAEYTLGLGDVLVLYTDGLVQRPGRSASENTVELLQVVQQSRRGGRAAAAKEQVVQRVCRQVVEMLTRITGLDDDIAVIAAQRVPPVAPLDVGLPAEWASVGEVRALLRAWLGDLWVGAMDTMALQHAVGELVTNAVEHAYAGRASPEQGSVQVRFSLGPDGTIEIDVEDRGRWRSPNADARRGRGLAMARGLADELSVERDALGTRARLRHRPTIAPEFLSVTADAERARASRRRPLEFTFGGAWLALSGRVDRWSAADLRRSLAHITRGGTTHVLVDLSAVSLLASAGVQVLVEELTRPEVSIRLLAPIGSPAQHVLDLVRLPYVTA
ncbi:MAG: regulator of sigma subunit, anti-anti-sigma factor RsbU [Nocardioides sp.]|nr:regulator of sigma subunit, anti-anti-sigma factor RsbU [Nocardioides sp.]